MTEFFVLFCFHLKPFAGRKTTIKLAALECGFFVVINYGISSETWFQRHLHAQNPHPFCQPKPVHPAAGSSDLLRPKPFTYETTRFQLTYSSCEYSGCFPLSGQPSLAPPPHTGFSSCACHKLQFSVDITCLL